MRKSIFLLFIIIPLFYQSNAQRIDIDSVSFSGNYQYLIQANCEKLPRHIDERDLTLPKSDFFGKIGGDFWDSLSIPKILIINEDHLFPQNRAFVHYVLNKLLKENSHYYVFFEALNSGNSIIGQDYVNNTALQGYYFQEPQAAANLRLVLKQTHRAFGYESLDKKMNLAEFSNLGLHNRANDSLLKKIIRNSKDSTTIIRGMNIRDFNQFVNFYKQYKAITEKDSLAKFIILLGFDHIDESVMTCFGANECWFTFAYQLRYFLKINPFTVDLTNYIPSCEDDRNPYYDLFYRKALDSNLYYYVNFDNLFSEKKIFRTIKNITNYYVISPPIKYFNGKPNWMHWSGRKKWIIPQKVLSQLKVGEAIKAIYINEENTSTPGDISYYKRGLPNILLLYPGEYRIIDGKGKVLLKHINVY